MRHCPPLRSLAVLLLSASTSACAEGSLNLFSTQDDLDLGAQLRDEILADPETYPVVDEADAPEAYEYLDMVTDELLATGEVRYADEFAWEVYLIDDDETLNAFAAPGGYIWVYSGLIQYLEEDDYFVGVMGHELAHAAERHSTEQLTRIYGLSTLISLILGNDPGTLVEIAAGLVNLSFSRTAEAEADERSVVYLCETGWAADGTAGFFAQLEEEGEASLPEFLSTHPSPESRVQDIRAYAESLGCDTTLSDDGDAWEDFQASLP